MSPDNFNFAYFVGDLIFAFPAWLLLFYFKKDLRKEMIFSGVLLGVLSILTARFFINDYWHPENLNKLRFVIGDFFFGFFPGAVACVIYEGLFSKRLLKRDSRYHWKLFIWPLLIIGGALFFFFLYLGLNSMYASSIALIVMAIVIVIFRRDLFWDTILSSLLYGLICMVGYKILFSIYPGILEAWWLSAGASGTLIIGIPIEELVFQFSLGMAMGPIYEFVIGARFRKSRL
jgi:hypothetical protein